MNTLREDLIAAKALIGVGRSAHSAIHQAASDGSGRRPRRYATMFDALKSENGGEVTNLLNEIHTQTHLAELLDLFDRAIARSPTTHTEGE